MTKGDVPRLNVLECSSASYKQRDQLDPKRMIVNVWAHNLKEELAKIMDIVDDFPFISMDTEFPGVVARPIGSFRSAHHYHYQTLKTNVDMLRIIQLGLCFTDAQGNTPPGACVWQFNFKFNLGEDMFAQDSIDLLIASGLDFKEHDQNGIDVHDFGEQLMMSGVVLNEDVRWLTFHSSYDFGYLLKVLTCQDLPQEEKDFFELLKIYFPGVYDIKHMMAQCDGLRGGLAKLSQDLGMVRIGQQHQAGSDSLLTAATYFKMAEKFFNKVPSEEKHLNKLFGLSSTETKT
jgi:CCR4-NOT transcription complex subunit 7/8